MDNHIQIIEDKIFTIRGQQVMLDRDLAELYQVTTKRLNEQVKRNIKKFPSDFMFKLTEDEWQSLRSQIATSKKKRGGRTYIPFVFTEIGCNTVSGILNTDVANARSIFIHRAFVAMKHQVFSNPNYELLKEQILRLQSETKLFNAKAETIHAEMVALKSDHKVDLNVQNMEIEDVNEKMTELLKEFNKFRDASIIIQKDPGIGRG
jgi:hypothetical protein